MRIRFFKALWGMEGSLDDKLAKIKAAGYDGFEDWIQPHFTIQPAMQKHGLAHIALVDSTNLESFKRNLGEAHDCGVTSITVHTGSSTWTFDQGMDHIGKALEIAKGVPFPVNFETHRARLFYEPNSTYAALQAHPDLHLVADLSHWTCVTSGMLGNYLKQLALTIERTRHVHCRVGYEQGPQVPDPRAPMWESHVKMFEAMWDGIKAAHEKRGASELTLDPEFGPPDYQPTDPKTGAPLADIWDVALWMTSRLKKRWSV